MQVLHATFVAVSQSLNRNVGEVQLLVVHIHTVKKKKALGEPVEEPTAFVMSNCQVPDCISFKFAWIPSLL